MHTYPPTDHPPPTARQTKFMTDKKKQGKTGTRTRELKAAEGPVGVLVAPRRRLYSRDLGRSLRTNRDLVLLKGLNSHNFRAVEGCWARGRVRHIRHQKQEKQLEDPSILSGLG